MTHPRPAEFILGLALAFVLGLILLYVNGCSAAQIKADETAGAAISCDACIVGCVGCGGTQSLEQKGACAICLVSCGIVVTTARDAGGQ